MKVKIINAFTNSPDGGNPAGVVLKADGLTDRDMQTIAYDVGISETAYIMTSSKADLKFRFFTPNMEVPLCGHATVASWWLMTKMGKYKPGKYTMETNDGIVSIEIEKNGKVFMEQPQQEFLDIFDVNLISKTLGISNKLISSDSPIQLVNKNLMIGINSATELDSLSPIKDHLMNLSEEYDFYGFHVFVLLNDEQLLAKVRNFCPRVGIDEDAATGTANGSFLEYLMHYDKLPRQDWYLIRQGQAMGRPSNIYGLFRDKKIWIGGKAIDVKEVLINI